MLHYLLNEPDSRHFQTHSGQCLQGETATSIEQKNVLNLSDLWHPLSWVQQGGKMGGHWGGSVRSFYSLSPSFMSYVSVCLSRPIDNSNPQGHVVLSTMCSYQRIHVFFFFFDRAAYRTWKGTVAYQLQCRCVTAPLMHDVTEITRVSTHWYREPELYKRNMLRAATGRQCLEFRSWTKTIITHHSITTLTLQHQKI